jgi:hypothetical protein
MMNKFFSVMALSLLISQSVWAQNDRVWYKPAAYPETFKLNRDECNFQTSNRETYEACMNRSGWTLVDRSRVESDRKECREKVPAVKNDPKNTNAYFLCLREKGWDEEPNSVRKLRQLIIQTNEICQKPEYAELITSIPCHVRDISLEHLASIEKVTNENKKVFLNYFKELEDVRTKALQALRNGSMANKRTYDFRTGGWDAKIDDNRVNLVTGKITFGEYNKHRKELEAEYQQNINKINDEVKEFIKTPSPKKQ